MDRTLFECYYDGGKCLHIDNKANSEGSALR